MTSSEYTVYHVSSAWLVPEVHDYNHWKHGKIRQSSHQLHNIYKHNNLLVAHAMPIDQYIAAPTICIAQSHDTKTSWRKLAQNTPLSPTLIITVKSDTIVEWWRFTAHKHRKVNLCQLCGGKPAQLATTNNLICIKIYQNFCRHA